MSKRIDPFNVIDAAAQYTSDNLMHVANIQWTDFDFLVRTVLDSIPENCKDAFLDDVTSPNFKI